ncbi:MULTISPECIES: molybdate ABC transporter permease subunit [Ralstonia]|jgi:molybdate transport system permease protein|uniref:molybdate ABC transporter permease subunit n=1 Tax=Ralstonia TaxID=48736 RepID=UPI0015F7EAC9|nr:MULTISPECIES: molybdate ABC transporter permease subunit [Ralstonia]MBE3060986.1 molybdate ABC transporter permease subunit [Cutibacterium acnes]MEA3270099.1 molybdate ABC transporter permease subunit [Pseudomonadota bacterium]MBB0179462.1 molybdate ABC transporter permease subunit [Ralstonia pickettii]MBB0203080.1 molybdate ABC transporter permease subunit [Ralstonia pickettii]MBX3808305.1 molybdate ABC transporter permease subunit [Ralstonia pickettii]
MDWQALSLSLQLAAVTLAILLPAGLCLGRWLAYTAFTGKAWIEALVVLPLVLPPTVLGYYLLSSLGSASPLGAWVAQAFNLRLTFNFLGLVLASIVFNVPFLVQPVQRAFEAIPRQLGEAAAVSGLNGWQTFWRVELPLAWPGVLSAMVLTFVHTLGEFGVVLMIGGSIPGETKTIAIAIYDRVQAFDLTAANHMALLLVVLSLGAVASSLFASTRLTARR